MTRTDEGSSMKIPFLPLHIVKTQVLVEALQQKDKLDAMRCLTSDFIPDIDVLLIARREARIGSSAYGRRKARRKLERKAEIVRLGMRLEIDEKMPDGEALIKFPEGQEHKNVRIVNIG